MGTTLSELKETFTGDIILPQDAGYEQARAVMVRKGSPALVVKPRTPEDIAAAIKYARDNSLVLSVRSGGHSNAGFSTNDGGIIIDLAYFKGIELLGGDSVKIGAGAIWGDVALELEKHGLAISSGDTRTVGVGGLTLGAGVGWMVRKYGLAIDSLVGAEIVTADGTLRKVDAEHDADLFWAVRGGGGNFGVVTSFTFTAHRTGQVYAGSITFERKDLGALLKGWRDCMRNAPEELTTMFLIMPAFGGNAPAAIVLCCVASDDEAFVNKTLAPLLAAGKVVANTVAKKDYAAVLEDAHVPEGIKIIVNNAFVHEFSDELISTIAPLDNSILQIRSLGGAVDRVAPDATAFAHRGNEMLIVMPTFLPLDTPEAATDTALEPWRKVAAFGNGAYCNFFSHATKAEVDATYPADTQKRLAAIKNTYDPQNIFNQNINITPQV